MADDKKLERDLPTCVDLKTVTVLDPGAVEALKIDATPPLAGDLVEFAKLEHTPLSAEPLRVLRLEEIDPALG